MEHLALAPDQGLYLLTKFSEVLRARLEATAKDPDVAGFKSVVCYRTGLDVSVVPNMDAEVEAMNVASLRFGVGTNTPLRLADKALNDLVVRTTIEVAAEHGKPGMMLFVFVFYAYKRLFFFRVHRSPQCSSIPVLEMQISR
jgi:hypothetical protein